MYYAYYRVSTETQAEKGGGLETQRQNIEKYCASRGIHLDGEFVDAGISGAVKPTEDDDAIRKRPALMDMLVTAKDGDSVLVMNTSRLWRTDTAKVFIRRILMRNNVNVISIEQPQFNLYSLNPNDKLFAVIMEAMDEWERDTIALKLAKGRTAKARNGDKPAGCCPHGYHYTADKKHVEVDEAEAAAVRLMFTEGQKGRSLSEIAAIVKEAGYRTRRGGTWSAGSVQAILRNRFYVGELTHQGKTIAGNHPAIISKVQFGKVAKQLESRKRG